MLMHSSAGQSSGCWKSCSMTSCITSRTESFTLFFSTAVTKVCRCITKNENYCIKQQHRSLMLTKINVVMRINIQVYLLNSLVNVHTFQALSVEIFLHSIFTLFYHKMYQKHSRVKAEHILCHCCLSLLSTEH